MERENNKFLIRARLGNQQYKSTSIFIFIIIFFLISALSIGIRTLYFYWLGDGLIYRYGDSINKLIQMRINVLWEMYFQMDLATFLFMFLIANYFFVFKFQIEPHSSRLLWILCLKNNKPLMQRNSKPINDIKVIGWLLKANWFSNICSRFINCILFIKIKNIIVP